MILRNQLIKVSVIILFSLIVLIEGILGILSVISGTSISVIGSAIMHSYNPLDIEGSFFFESSRELGKNTHVVEICDLLRGFFSQSPGICRGAYAVQNNKLEICLALEDDDMSQKPYCLTQFAIKNKDISFCDKMEGSGRDYSREYCRSDVLRRFPDL